MTQTLGELQRKIKTATELQSVVTTMKTLAAVNVGTYEKVELSLTQYHQTIELGLVAVLHQFRHFASSPPEVPGKQAGAVVFGSDQGMVGPFNDHLADTVSNHFDKPGQDIIWPVGERVALKLQDRMKVEQPYRVPDSMAGITALVSRIVIDITTRRQAGEISQLFLFYNKPLTGTMVEPTVRQLLPVDRRWLAELEQKTWTTNMLPQVMPDSEAAFAGFFREYLFISLCRACASSLVSENISRLASMERAAENIEDLLDQLNTEYNQERQSSITAELFDVIFGYNAVLQDNRGKKGRKQ